MEQYKIFVVLFALISLNKAVPVLPKLPVEPGVEPNFKGALELIENEPPIRYLIGQFCSETEEGEDKIACRINKVPTVGLLVCKKAATVVDKEPCDHVINIELQNLAKLRDAGLRTVLFHEKPINDLNCRDDVGQVCRGYLEEWVDKNRGQFKHIRNAIVENKVPELIREVKKLTPDAELLAATATDLMDIKDYMLEPETNHRQICDLQGFFLKNGGFLINDVPDILEKVGDGLTDRCYDSLGEPTTQEVLTALNNMIQAFGQS